jgi:archaellin
MKNWKTTVAAVVAAILVILGMFLPDKFDPEAQATVNSAVNEILTGVGALIAVITGLVAKDPDK